MKDPCEVGRTASTAPVLQMRLTEVKWPEAVNNEPEFESSEVQCSLSYMIIRMWNLTSFFFDLHLSKLVSQHRLKESTQIKSLLLAVHTHAQAQVTLALRLKTAKGAIIIFSESSVRIHGSINFSAIKLTYCKRKKRKRKKLVNKSDINILYEKPLPAQPFGGPRGNAKDRKNICESLTTGISREA